MKRFLSVSCLVLSMFALVLLVAARLLQPEAVAQRPVVQPTVSDTPVAVATPEPTPEPTPTPTPEPEPEHHTLSFIGDCTLITHQNVAEGSPYHYGTYMNGDYGYPFKNTVEYFANDDYTIGNLECTFADVQLYSPQTFYFRAPSEWANILVEGEVDFVTTANNHTMDFYEAGRDFTYEALENVNMSYGKNGEAQIVTTESGLKLGIYCAYDDSFIPNTQKAVAAIEQLKNDGAEYIICAFHWGIELKFRPLEAQTNLAHACIDAGADLIYGSHPHVLQPIEEYNDGLILYSMGNWSFGGSTQPKDCDTAIVQVDVKRDLDGTVSTDGYTVIPCCISSTLSMSANGGYYNDYCPTPYEEGTEAYDRALSKIMGTYEGPDLDADYSNWYASWG